MPPPVVDLGPDSIAPRAAGSTWTGGQYSLVRFLFGAWLGGWFVRLLVLDPEMPLFWIGLPASLLLALGAFDRVAAALIAGIWIWLVRTQPELPTPGMPWIAVLLLAHLTVPPAPYGSWRARGRADPAGSWRMQLPVFQLAWGMLLLGTVVDLFDQLGRSFWREGTSLQRAWIATTLLVEVALFAGVFKPRSRALTWCAALVWRLLLLGLGGSDDRQRGLLLAQLFAFDPIWLPAIKATTREHLFFDGTCGLCHRWVRIAAAEDRGSSFFYSPLQGEAIRTLLTDEQRAGLPDTVVVRADDGRLLVRSDAVVHVTRRLGGAWRAFGAVLESLPRRLRDGGYDRVARVRRRLFKAPKESCPILSPRLRTTFLP